MSDAVDYGPLSRESLFSEKPKDPLDKPSGIYRARLRGGSEKPKDPLEAVRVPAGRTIDIDVVNRVLLQPHWQNQVDLTDF